MRIVGVLPAAGHALRLQPLDRSKELLEVGGRPVIDYLVERMRAGGAQELRVVTRPEKHDVVAYTHSIGASLVLGRPATINDSFAAGIAGVEPEAIVLLGFPDSLWQPLDGFRRLVEAVEQGADAALGLFRVPELTGSDYLELDPSGRITRFHIKPEAPPSDWIWGCAAARARTLTDMQREEWPSAFMASLQDRGLELTGVPLSDSYLDLGTPESLDRLREVTWLGPKPLP